MENVRDYRLFGLRVRSELELPELVSVPIAGEPDVSIRLGSVDGAARAFGIEQGDDGLVFEVPDVACYRIRRGSDILIEPAGSVPERNLRLYLLGSAFGALLHQRRLLPIHANAVEIDGQAVAFMGASGAGKSTLAAWFHDRGHRIIADDVCVVGFDGAGKPYAAPGPRRLRLWAEALEVTGRDARDFERSYVGGDSEKFDVPIGSDGSADDVIGIAALCSLEQGDQFNLTRLTGLAAAEAVIENTYRGSFVSAAKAQQAHWESVIRLVRGTPVFRVVREWDLGTLDEQCATLLVELRAVIADH